MDAKLPRFDGDSIFVSDTTLIFEDGAGLHAHTTILSQRSPVLAEAFELQHGQHFELKSSSSHAWRAILSHMYDMDIDMNAFDLVSGTPQNKLLIDCYVRESLALSEHHAVPRGSNRGAATSPFVPLFKHSRKMLAESRLQLTTP